MAGHEDTGSDAKPEPGRESVTPFGTPTPLHREKPIIEGQAIHLPEPEAEKPAAAASEGSDASPSEPLAEVKLAMEELLAGDEELADREKAAASAEAAATGAGTTPPETPETNVPPPVAAPPQPRQGLSFLAIVVVALIGAATGFASAYVARLFLDDTHKSLAGFDDRLAGLNSKLVADETKIDTASASSRDALSALDKRLAAAEKSAGDALSRATAAQTAAQKAASSNTGTNDPAVAIPASVDLTPLQSRIDALEQRLSELEAAVNAPKTDVRAPQEPEAKLNPQDANAPAIAILAENLIAKIANGAPFTTELAALEKLGTDKTKLAPLQSSAAKGVITAKALADQFDALAPSLLASEKPVAQGNAFERLMSHAASLVRIHKIGDLSGEDLSAQVARVKDALAHEDVDRALQEWAAFPETAKMASANWAEAAKTRVVALTAAKAIATDAMDNLVKVKS
jgi:hypothetical protein